MKKWRWKGKVSPFLSYISVFNKKMTFLESSNLIELHYFGNIQYFSKFCQGKKVIIEQFENYSKGSYRNRMYIAGAAGPLRLSIPLAKGKNERLPITQVQISNTTDWQRQHWVSIQSAYGKSPFFEYYSDELKNFYQQPYPLLFDWNKALLHWLLETIDSTTEVEYSTAYQQTPETQITDLRESISPRFPPQVADPAFKLSPYAQVFEDRTGFQANLCILDLLFCKGPEAIVYLHNLGSNH